MAVAKESPITPAVLAWVLEEDGRSPREIADVLNISPDRLTAWIEGEARPTVGEVSSMAAKLHRPRALFFLPSPPSSKLPIGFRRPPGSEDTRVPASVLLQMRRARRMQRAVASAVSPDAAPGLPLATAAERPATAARRVRDWLGIETTPRWKSEYDALNRWRQTVDEAGVLVFQLALGADEIRGFADYDDRAPMIVLNQSRVAPEARLYTLGHELAHLVLREATACLEPARGRLTIDTATERWCEQFAAALIMPEDEVRALMLEHGVELEGAELATVKLVTTRFRCSGRAAALRLMHLGYGKSGLYAAVQAVYRPAGGPSEKQKGRNPPRHRLRLREYGSRAVETVMATLPADEALSVLRMTVKDARALADEVPGVRAP